MKNSANIEKMIQIAQRGNSNVLITGPTGSGKSFLARKIHCESQRRQKPFVAVNLACLHEGTFESELFGHERGAFTGADQRRVGRLEQANGGTVFLDEVGELPLRLQARLLEFLQSRTITPVGSNREIKLDIRVISATNRNLEQAIMKREFREDLYHRLRVIPIELLSLISRADHFDEIFHECLEDVVKNSGRNVLRLSEEVALKFENYTWPGNFRELRNVLEFAVLSGEGPEIALTDLPPWFGKTQDFRDELEQDTSTVETQRKSKNSSYAEVLADFEKDYLQSQLKRFGGRINMTARRIGMNKTTLIRRIRHYGIQVEHFFEMEGPSYARKE